jgi:nucleotide-binding universal stress UspA family protein
MIPQRIVVATDGSAAARAAESLAADMAGLMSSTRPVEVVVVTAVHDPGHLASGASGVIPQSAEVGDAIAVSNRGADHVRELLAGVPSGQEVKVEAKVLEALTPGGAIIAEAHAAGTCSLIVLGNRGHGGLAEAVLGSVSQDVVHRAHCPVMIARA